MKIARAILLFLAVLPLGPQRAGAQQAAPDSVVAGATARIHPGDQIGLRIFQEPEMSGVFTVAETGDAVLPRLGSVRVVDQSAGSLQQSLRTAYMRYLRDPALEVTVLRRVGVHGEVRRPDLYMVDLTMTLRDVIAKAGGITDAGDPSRIEIVRGEQRFRISDSESGQFMAAELRSGDQIVVGRRNWIARNPNVAIGTGTALVTFFIGLVQLFK